MTNKTALCYTPRAWQFYIEGSLAEKECYSMAEHLLECERCLGFYLQLMEEGAILKGCSELSDPFTDRVMTLIEADPPVLTEVPDQRTSAFKAKDKKNFKWNLLISYCAAACIAMFFWVGGYFDGIANGLVNSVEMMNIPQIVEKETKTKKFSLIQTGWSKKSIEKQPFPFDYFRLKKE